MSDLSNPLLCLNLPEYFAITNNTVTHGLSNSSRGLRSGLVEMAVADEDRAGNGAGELDHPQDLR